LELIYCGLGLAEQDPTIGIRLNVAVTFLACVIETVQVPVPEQLPDQPAKEEPAVGTAVRTTDVPVV
jgi:hypothetical protein